jgi:hypothetical protein
MESSELGASLLADTRERADKLSREAESRAKKQAWKNLGAQVLIGAVDSAFDQRQQEFLDNETNMANKLKIKTANNRASQVTETQAAQDAYAGGTEAFWSAKALPMVEDHIKSNYADGTYNESTKNVYAKNLADKYGRHLKEAHDKEYATTLSFLQTTGGDTEAYNRLLARQKGKGIKGFVAEMIGKGTGFVNKDAANLSSNMLDSADQVIQFKKAHAQTNDVGLSQFLAKNDLLKKVDLGTPTPTVGTFTKLKNHVTGEEVLTAPIVSKNKDGSLNITTVQAGDNGFTFSKSDVAIAEQTFSSIVNNAVAKKNSSPIVAAGMSSFANISDSDNKEFQNHIIDRLEASGLKRSEPHFDSSANLAKDRYHANVGASIYMLQSQGFGGSAGPIANELALNSIKTPINKVLSGAGQSNPWHTLHATFNAVSKGTTGIPKNTMTTLVTENSLNLLRSYRSETTAGRENIDLFLNKNSYFETMGVNEKDALKTAHMAIKKIVDFPKEFEGMSDSQALSAAIK